ncbi:hypothetical protein ST47_g8971 [Ascochyta rabiei]|uniref:Uncharacterized protein n=1 Tax=Didymella rabiei TaxID=5454 RepID=A0A162XRS6_DIDRA|nr:hypothetical protein ST47_g8971 [Ascochyta rabiei]
MNIVTKATNSIATRAEGAFANCRGSDGYELSYSCQGPACSSLDVNFQNIVCHKDGSSRLICSNDTKCQHDASPYQSNFTFSQNEPDPWSPVMGNEPDTWVHQDQHVLLGSCARFSLTSDGTKQGTRVHDEGQSDICPNFQGLPISSIDSGIVAMTSSTGQFHVDTTDRPLVFEGTSPRHAISKSTVLFAFIFGFVFFLPGSQASGVHQHLEQPRQRTDTRTRTVFSRARNFAEGFKTELAQRSNSQTADGEVFAHNLVADIVLSVCQGYFNGAIPSNFTPAIVQSCVASIYGGGQLLPPAIQFLAVFGASLACDYIVSEAYPNGRDFLPGGCEELEDLTSKILVKASTTVSSVPTISSSSSTQTASIGAIPTDRPLSDEQVSNQPIDALSQTIVPDIDFSNLVPPHTLPAGTTLSKMSPSSRTGAKISFADAETLPTYAVSLAGLSSAGSSARILSSPLLTPLPELPSAGLPLSDLSSTGVPPDTSAPIESFATKNTPSNSFLSEELDINSAASIWSTIASQDISSAVPSQSMQSTPGIPNQSIKENSDTSVNMIDSKPVSPLRASSWSFTSVLSSRTQPTISTPLVFAVSQALHSATTSSSPMSSRSDSSQSTAISVFITLSPPTPPSGTSAISTPILSSYLTSSYYSIQRVLSSSVSNRSRSNADPSNISPPSKPTSDPLQSKSGTSVNSESESISSSLISDESVAIGVLDAVSSAVAIQSPSQESITSSEPGIATQVSSSLQVLSESSRAGPVISISPNVLSTPDSSKTPSTSVLMLFGSAGLLSFEFVSGSGISSSSSQDSLISSHEFTTSIQAFESSTNTQTSQGLQTSVEVIMVVTASTDAISFATSSLENSVSSAYDPKLSTSKPPPHLGMQQISESLEWPTSPTAPAVLLGELGTDLYVALVPSTVSESLQIFSKAVEYLSSPSLLPSNIREQGPSSLSTILTGHMSSSNSSFTLANASVSTIAIASEVTVPSNSVSRLGAGTPLSVEDVLVNSAAPASQSSEPSDASKFVTRPTIDPAFASVKPFPTLKDTVTGLPGATRLAKQYSTSTQVNLLPTLSTSPTISTASDTGAKTPAISKIVLPSHLVKITSIYSSGSELGHKQIRLIPSLYHGVHHNSFFEDVIDYGSSHLQPGTFTST